MRTASLFIHGKVVLRWGDQQQTYDLKSSTKAIGVTAVGLALLDGKLQSLHDPASKYHPTFGVPPDSNRENEASENITLVIQPEDYGNAPDHYGLLWWNNADGTLPNVPRDAYWSWGLYDSLIVVIPSLDVVVARAGKSLSQTRDPHYAPVEPFLSPIAISVKDRGQSPGTPYPPSDFIHRIERAPADQGGFGTCEAPEPWGPWRTVYYTETWDIGPGETASLPPKWMSEDGRTCHRLFSGNDCFSVRTVTLLLEEERARCRFLPNAKASRSCCWAAATTTTSFSGPGGR